VSATSAGAAHITALSAHPDGALAVSAGTYYVFAGGRAFGVPTPAVLARLRQTDTETPLAGAVAPGETGAPVVGGVLLSVHFEGVFATYQGELFQFKTMGQLMKDGYGGTAAVPVPGTEGFPAPYPYSGS
jgi:hypothetical protein